MLKSASKFLISIDINLTHLSAGLAGSLVRSLLISGKSQWEVVSGPVISTLSAVCLTPIVVNWLALDATQISSTNGIAFDFGVIGMSLAGAVRLAQRCAANPKLPEELSIKGFARGQRKARTTLAPSEFSAGLNTSKLIEVPKCH